MPHRTVRANDAVVEHLDGALVNQLGRRGSARAVLGVDQRRDLLVGGARPGRQSDEPAQLVAERERRFRQVPFPRPDPGKRLRIGKLALAIAQAAFCVDAGGDVSGDRRDPQHPAVVVAQRRHGQRHIDATAVFAYLNRLVLDHRLTGEREIEQPSPPISALGRDEHRNRGAHHLVGGVAVQPLRAPVPEADDPLGRRQDDRVVGLPQHRVGEQQLRPALRSDAVTQPSGSIFNRGLAGLGDVHRPFIVGLSAGLDLGRTEDEATISEPVLRRDNPSQ